ncbi:MAG TPA: Hpt domain-containing protein, partial [Bryobacteraceae bacterium]|nr:Hpt domain-containing protein [Bryobacteraceae bacterium]
DERSALSLTDGDVDLLRELAQLFLAEYPVLMTSLRKAVSQGDATGVQTSAHSIKGSLGHFGARRLAERALDIEMGGRSGDLSGFKEKLAQFEASMAPFVEELLEFSRR